MPDQHAVVHHASTKDEKKNRRGFRISRELQAAFESDPPIRHRMAIKEEHLPKPDAPSGENPEKASEEL